MKLNESRNNNVPYAQELLPVIVDSVDEEPGVRQTTHTCGRGQQQPDSVDVEQHCKAACTATGNDHVSRVIHSEATEIRYCGGKNGNSVK